MKIQTEQELADAVLRGDSHIEIEGSLVKGVLAIRASGAKAWLMVSTLLVAALAVSLAMRRPALTFPLVSGMGAGSASVAIKLCYAAGGIGILSVLREYQAMEQEKHYLKLRK